jgi:predicted metal-dependent HD superfamily phosphohydrolase
MPDSADLRAAWSRLAGTGGAAVAAGDDLLNRWAEPHRSYHNRAHLAAVLSHLDRLGPAAVTVRLGAWYHDAVYQPGRADNEERSAELAREGLRAIGVEPGAVLEVVRLVHLTAAHRAEPADTDGAMLCDADLAVLGSAPAGYESYRRAVRAEYAAVDDGAWRAGRSRVLEEFLDRDRIFATQTGHRLWEQAAQANLSRELRDLRGMGC